MILTTSSMLQVVLSATTILLVVITGWKAVDIFREWDEADQEERYALEKNSYLTMTAVVIALGIRLFMVPLFFWTMQGFVPSIPGAMCLWGVFNAIPSLAWGDLLTKIVLPVLYVGWLLMVLLNSRSGTNSAMRGLMAFFLLISPLAVVDSALDISIMLGIKPVEVSCCSNAIDVGPRPLPAAIGDVSGQTILLVAFLASSLVFIAILRVSRKSRIWLAASLVTSIVLAIGFTLTLTEVLTPWLLDLPFHHCPFCLLFLHPLSILFTTLFWVGISAPWLVTMASVFGRYSALSGIEREFSGKLIWLSCVRWRQRSS